MGWYRYGGFPPYVRVADRKKQAAKVVDKLKKKGEQVQPVLIEGRTITKTFWGNAWCKNLESYSDFENRLPRGRTYVRNGSVIDLKVAKGEINALVAGSSVYKVKIVISQVIKSKWKTIVNECVGKIDSIIELLQGKFSQGIMKIITHPERGLFPQPKEIKLNCSCPDWADMCKHVAAVLYGVGARLDERPEELFLLRQADHADLIAKAGTKSLVKTRKDNSDQVLADSELSSLFGIDIGDQFPNSTNSKAKTSRTKSRKATVRKNIVNKKAQTKRKKDLV